MSNKKKNKGLFEGKNKWVIISTIAFLLLGIVALVLGFGFANGFMSVLLWFGSRWAIYVYIIIALLLFLLAWVIFKQKIGDD